MLNVCIHAFAQHMLFLGTKKYPEENSYNTFLNQNGGYSNAFTASEETNYFFEVQHEKLEVLLLLARSLARSLAVWATCFPSSSEN